MKNSAIRFIMALLALVIGASLEDALPKFAGVGFPLLLASLPFFALRGPAFLVVAFALAAGACEDSLSGLCWLASASFFLVAAFAMRLLRLPMLVAAFAFPVYQLWIAAWPGSLLGTLGLRFLLSIPVGLVTVVAVTTLLNAIERKAGADEAG